MAIIRMLGIAKNANDTLSVIDILEFDRSNPRHYTPRRAKKALWRQGCCQIRVINMTTGKEKICIS